MRLILLICLMFMSACTVPGQAESIAGEQPAALTTPIDEPVAVSMNEPATQPTAVPLADNAVLLLQWNREQRQYELRLVNPATGESVGSDAPLSLGGNPMYTLSHTLSTDGRWLAVIESNGQSCESISIGSACRARADALHLVDAELWQVATVALPGTGWAEPLVFSPDNARLALAYHDSETSTLLLFDTTSGKEVAQRSLDFRPALLTFASNSSLALVGAPEGKKRGISEPGPLRLLLLDGKSLADLWQQPLPEIVSGNWCTEGCGESHEAWRMVAWTPAMSLSPDGRFLHIMHADDNRLTTVDLDSRSVNTASIERAQSWLERLLALTAGTAEAKSLLDGAYKSATLSPDGARLYVVGNAWQIVEDDDGRPMQQLERQGLQVVDPASGYLLETRHTEADRVRMSRDGAYLLLDGWDQNGRWTEIIDAGSLKAVTRLNEWEVTAAPQSDGGMVLLASRFREQQIEFAIVRPPAFAIEPAWSADPPASWLTH